MPQYVNIQKTRTVTRSLGHGLYGSITKRSLQNQYIIIQKNNYATGNILHSKFLDPISKFSDVDVCDFYSYRELV